MARVDRRPPAARWRRGIAQGDVDSVVNLLLFGTSFTTEPRITARLLSELNQKWNAGDRSVAGDARAPLSAARRGSGHAVWAAAGTDARLQDVRRVLTAHGHSLDTATGQRAAIQDLLASVARVREEAARLAEELEAQRRATDATAGFAERSRIFAIADSSADSSVLTQFAVDRAVCALGERGVLAARSVNRIAIVGPGLDFVDKQEGFDFYAPQSLQPFTLADSLLQCGLATRSAISITTIDISPRVNGHLRAAVVARRPPRRLSPGPAVERRMRAGQRDAAAYWKRAGDPRSDAPFAVAGAARHAAVAGARRRGVAGNRPAHPAARRQHRLRSAGAAGERQFDLVLASNVLVYYDTFEQTLALASVAAMLKPGGVLLTNDAVLEIPEVPLRSAGSVGVPFSDRPGDGERMVWYVKSDGEGDSAGFQLARSQRLTARPRQRLVRSGETESRALERTPALRTRNSLDRCSDRSSSVTMPSTTGGDCAYFIASTKSLIALRTWSDRSTNSTPVRYRAATSVSSPM